MNPIPSFPEYGAPYNWQGAMPIAFMAFDPRSAGLPPAQRHPLFQAIQCDDIDGVNRLIDQGYGFEEEDNMTPLQLSASLGRLEMCRALIERAGVVLETENNKHTALHCASANSHEAVCRYLLEKGADVFLRDGRGKTPLEVALLQRASPSIVALLTQAENAASNVPGLVSGYFPLVGAIPQVPVFGLPQLQMNLNGGDLGQEHHFNQVKLEQQHLAKYADLEQRHLERQAQLERDLEESKGVIARKSQLVDGFKVQVETLTEQIKSQSETEGTLQTELAKLEQDHLEKQARWERELVGWKAVVADKSKSEEACRVELRNLTVKAKSKSVAKDELRENVATYKAKVCELSSRLKECEEERTAAVTSCSTMESVLAGVKKAKELSELQQHDKKHSVKVDELEHVVQDLKSQLQITHGFLYMAKEDLEKAQTSEREKAQEIARLEADARRKQLGHEALVQQLIKVAEEKALKAERELAEAKRHPTASLGLAELKNCTKAKQRIAELEEASQVAADKLETLETCNAKYIKTIESSKQELESSEQKLGYLKQELKSSKQKLEDVSLEVAKLERKVGLKNERIHDLVEALDAANEKAEREIAEVKQHSTLGLAELKNCTKAKQRIAELEEASLIAADKLKVLETCNANYIKIVEWSKQELESSKQELKDVSTNFQRELGRKNERIRDLIGALNAANAKCNVTNEKLQATGLELKEERKANEAKQHLSSSLDLAEHKCSKAEEKIAELEEASLLAEGKLKSLETHNEEQAKLIESSKQELEGVSSKVESLERKLGRRNQRIEELTGALDAANAKCDVANEKLQATRLKLKEERKANEAKMISTVPVPDSSTSNNPKRVADSDVIEIPGPSRKKARCAEDMEEGGGSAVVVSGAGQNSTTYSSSYDTWYQNLLYCVNMMIAAKGGSTGKWPLSIERASNEKMALGVLDKMMEETALRTFFKVFEVKMTNAADGKGRGKKKKENTMEHGLDAGGLTNDLLGKVFNGLLEIKVNVLGNAQKKFLFADDENAAWALPLEDHEVTAEAAILYEGVGRLFLKAILSGANTEADTPTLIPDTVFNPCFLHLCLDRGITKSDAGNCMMSHEDVRDALESLLPPDHFGLWSADALIDKSASMNWATGDDADAETLVTHDNHDRYGRKFLERILSTRKVAFEHMKNGFFLTVDHERHGYIPPLKFFNSKQLRVLLCGKIVKPELILSTLNFVDGNHPDETGGEIGHTGDSWAAANMRDTKQWLIEFISNLDAQECEDFLNYCAAVVRIPYARSLTDGGGQSSFQIHVIARGGSEQRNALPSAQTCFRKLSLPAYTSYNELQKAFKVAFEHAGGYFGKE